jgi:hypothetical protein
MQCNSSATSWRIGPSGKSDIVDEAKQDGVSLRTVERAKRELRVESSKLKDEWLWSLSGARS